MFPGLDLYSSPTDPAQHLITAGTGSTVDDLYDLCDIYDLYGLYDVYNLYDLYYLYGRDMPEVCM